MGTTAEKLTYLNETKQELKEAINNLGGSIDNSTTFREYVEELEDIYSNLPKVTSEGTSVTLTPTKKGKLSLVEKGNSIQEGTPTPSTPIPIKSVTGNNNVVVNNKNLFTGLVKGKRINTTTGAEETNNNGSISDYIAVDFNTNPNYYLSGLTNTLNCFVGAYNSNKQFLGRTGANAILFLSLNKNSFTGGTPQGTGDIAYLRVTQYVTTGNTGTIDDIDNLKIQLEVGNSATSYEEHKETTLPLNLGTIELNKIGTYQDYIYKNNGKWYKKEQIGKVVLNGSESWWLQSTGTANWQYRTGAIADLNLINNISNGLCNLYTPATISNSNTTQGIYYNGSSFLAIRYGTEDTIANFKAFLGTHNLILYGTKATPTDIEITDTNLIDQLNAIDNMKSYEGTTIITSTYENGNAQMILSASSLKGE